MRGICPRGKYGGEMSYTRVSIACCDQPMRSLVGTSPLRSVVHHDDDDAHTLAAQLASAAQQSLSQHQHPQC